MADPSVMPMWVIRARGYASRAEHDAAQVAAVESIATFRAWLESGMAR